VEAGERLGFLPALCRRRSIPIASAIRCHLRSARCR
jgi:hypothetical protein